MGLLERFILLLMAMNQAAGGLSVRWDDAERLNHKLMKHKVILEYGVQIHCRGLGKAG